ncbi:maestro heat-like repeat-containing protein family member 7 isoform X6 [Podarcis raffonei]|uniref:maestro heat-like repeat-containing protein family member 7 isoform X6 n=1 Tax=Podarcis raffonei TaxID=65483 RepID=UPI0023299A19|nr:maestro heat-like repeat-containing protein family member 7 isoform X6 [Podarcis raffonei]
MCSQNSYTERWKCRNQKTELPEGENFPKTAQKGLGMLGGFVMLADLVERNLEAGWRGNRTKCPRALHAATLGCSSHLCSTRMRLMKPPWILLQYDVLFLPFQFLLPETGSPFVEERIMALSRITKLVCCITSHCTPKGMKDFKIGKLAGHLALCSKDSIESVCHWAADALHCLYTLILHQKSLMKPENNTEFMELMQDWKEEKIFWLAWFSDISTTTMKFKKCLHADEQMDFLLAAIKGMRDDNLYHTKAAILMLKAMLRDPQPVFIKVPKTTRFMYFSLEHIGDPQARLEVFRFLLLLGKSRPQDVVKTLLACSVQCDSIASAMWNSLICFSDTAQRVLGVLQSILQEQQIYWDGHRVNASLRPLAANAAFYEILRRPSPACREVLKEMFTTLSIAILCQISFAVYFTPEEMDVYTTACIRQEIPIPPAPFRSALKTFKGLIRRAGDEDLILIMNKRRGSELLLHRRTHLKGLALFAREIVRGKGSQRMLPYLLEILESEGYPKHITVMPFLIEFLHKGALAPAMEDIIIKQLCRQVKASRLELRSLALDGMICFLDHQEKASNKVRLAAISTFSHLFEIVQWGGKEQMKALALQSLVPLMVHLQDSVPVQKMCWITLRRADKFLKSFIQLSIRENETWNFCKSLVQRYREQGEAVLLDQAFDYLENPRTALRDGAIRLLEIIAQESKHQGTVNAIATVLDLVKVENKSSHLKMAVSEITEALGQEEQPSGNFLGRCFSRLRRIWKR